MDQNLQQKIDEARKNGYTDEEIQQYLATSQQPVEAQVPIDRSEEYKGLAQGMGLEVGGNMLDVGAKAAAVGAGAYGAKKAFDYLAGQRATQAAQQSMAQQAAQRQAQQVAARATGTAGQQVFGQMAEQLADNRIRFPGQATQPTVPSTTAPSGPIRPAEVPQQGMIDRAGQMVRQLAANKAVQNMARIGGTAASLSLFSPELGPQTPTIGRMRGMEINPMTRRPWTPQEITQYENNPMAFDSMLGPAQARR